MKTRKRQFLIHATAVAREHFLNPALERLARKLLRLAWRPEFDGTYYVRHVISTTDKPFVVALKPDGDKVHFFIDDDLEPLINAVRIVFPDYQMTCAL